MTTQRISYKWIRLTPGTEDAATVILARKAPGQNAIVVQYGRQEDGELWPESHATAALFYAEEITRLSELAAQLEAE